MRTVGVDLAAEPASTAVAVLDWRQGAAIVTDIAFPADDDAVLRLCEHADKVGIDCPLGWPDSFVEFVRAQRDTPLELATEQPGPAWRRSLAYRWTDERVRAVTGLIPLSVATDRIGLTAMRAVRLQSLLARQGHDIDRTGAGLLVEVYPAAGLKRWSLTHRRYKGGKHLAARTALIGDLCAAAPWLDLADAGELCLRQDHVLDAVIAALLARAAALGHTLGPTPAEAEAARTEGWIALPTCSLADLPS
ncbi:DUF429 domain-containing protein [Prauserella cavernicola]|uniref:DUF429 domain-containing protein n=1 Tax=Prauserella cavernicola TaxID=2800127 RepID=A0A934QR82_9PSEU|nr:DUF429 domain-containing protein [Prauserella cavernicola]MBK1783929.1 DUF429 domain-containing protein [Prauserella cavernicola]